MIDFKTYDEQIEILKNRGLVFENVEKAKHLLKVNNYYNVINGYKDKFILDNGTKYERFNKGVTFEEIFILYTFDKNLKHLLLKYILKIENMFKSIMAYVFAKNHKDGDYLNKNNFNNNLDKSIKFNVDSVINKLGDVIQEQKNKKNKMVCHYLDKYSFLPIWVLVNILTLGEISKLFTIFTTQDKIEVCKTLSELYNRTLFEKDIKTFMATLSWVRNICAHDQRLYDFSTGININTNNETIKKLGLTKSPKGIFAVLIVMNNLLEKSDFQELCFEFINILKDLSNIKSINVECIKKKMELPQDWDRIISI